MLVVVIDGGSGGDGEDFLVGYRRFWVNSTRHHSQYGSYYPRKSEFATGLVFERNSGCLKKHGGGLSLPRIYGSVESRGSLWFTGSAPSVLKCSMHGRVVWVQHACRLES